MTKKEIRKIINHIIEKTGDNCGCHYCDMQENYGYIHGLRDAIGE